MDISLLVMEKPPPNSDYYPGCIIDASLMHSDPCDHPRFVLVHVEGIPDNAPQAILMHRLKMMLQGSITEGVQRTQVRRRAWRINFKHIPTAAKDKLLQERSVIINWDKAKQYITRRLVVDNADPDQDGDVFLTDGDP